MTTNGEPAPLLNLPDAEAVGGAVWWTAADGLTLRAALFTPQNPVGSVVLSPGRTEPIEKYVEVIGELLRRSYVVLTHDWRGQGRSSRLLPDPMRGHADGFDAFLADFTDLIDGFEAQLPAPRIALGHSMGGALTLAALARGEPRFAAALLSAPMLAVQTGGRPAWQARLLAGLMTRLGRGGDYVLGGHRDPFAATFEQERLTHDHARYDRSRAQILADRSLALGNVTWGWLASAFRLEDEIAGSPRLTALNLPVTLLAAGDEALVRNDAIKAAAARIPQSRYVEIPGAYHELLMETDAIRAQVWAEFDGLARANAPPG